MAYTYKPSWRKYFIITALSGLISLGMWYIYYSAIPQGPIYDFNEQRDTHDILTIFKRDWYWLVASEDYSPEFMLKYRAPNKDPRYLGRLHIKVYREHDAFVGFIAYYMKTFYEGFILFLDVLPAFRGKRYGEQLVHHALDDLKRQGASKVQLVTRTNNTAAINLYKRINFYETSRDDAFVYFEKLIK